MCGRSPRHTGPATTREIHDKTHRRLSAGEIGGALERLRECRRHPVRADPHRRAAGGAVGFGLTDDDVVRRGVGGRRT